MSEHVTFNGKWYTVTSPKGDNWSFEPGIDEDLSYIDDSIAAWERWRDFVKGKRDAS